jgi:hypothetical protein
MDNDTRCLFLEAFCIYNVLPLGAPSTTEIGALLARGNSFTPNWSGEN